MKNPASLALLALPCALALSAVPAAQISGPTLMREVQRNDEPRAWIVDSAGGGDFLDLPEAVAAARSGDLIVVRSAGLSYTAFETSKGLTIVGQEGPVPTCPSAGPPPAVPCVLGQTEIHDLPSGEELVLRGFHFHTSSSQGQALEVRSCAGVVWVEDCSFTGQGVLVFLGSGSGPDGIRIQGSSKVVLTRSVVSKLFGSSFSGPPLTLTALRVDDATVFAFESQLVGPPGTICFQLCGGGMGGYGARLLGSSFLFGSGSTFQGGAGGNTRCEGTGACLGGGDGGIGLRVESTSEALLLDSTTLGGPGAPATSCFVPFGGSNPCSAESPGAPRIGPVSDIPLPARTLQVESPVAAGGTYRLTVVGQPGETVFSVYSEHAEASYVPLYFGPQLTAYPVTFVLEGAIPAGGVLEKDVPVPPLSLLTRFHRSFVQGLLFDELANAYLTSGSVLVVLAE